MNPPYLNLNDTDHFGASQQIQITNDGEEQVSYRLSHNPERTFFTRNTEARRIDFLPPSSVDVRDVAEVELSEQEITLQPGEMATIEVTFTEPSAPESDRFPVYGGAITVSGDNGETLKVIYMGELSLLCADRPLRLHSPY